MMYCKTFSLALFPQTCVVPHFWNTVPKKDVRSQGFLTRVVKIRCWKWYTTPPTYFRPPVLTRQIPSSSAVLQTGDQVVRARCIACRLAVTPRWCSFRCQLLPSCCSRWSRRDWWRNRSCVTTSAPSGRLRWLHWALPEPGARRRTSGRCWWRSAEDRGANVFNTAARSSLSWFIHWPELH